MRGCVDLGLIFDFFPFFYSLPLVVDKKNHVSPWRSLIPAIEWVLSSTRVEIGTVKVK